MVILRVCAGKRNGSLLCLWALAALFCRFFMSDITVGDGHRQLPVLNYSDHFLGPRGLHESPRMAQNWKSTFNSRILMTREICSDSDDAEGEEHCQKKKAEQVREHISGFQYIQRIKKDQLTTGPSSPASPFSPEGPAAPRRPASPCLPGGPPSPLIPLGPSFPEGPAGPAGPGLPWKKHTL